MLTTRFWTYEYDVWASLAFTFALSGVKQVMDLQPRKARTPFLTTLCALPALTLAWARSLGEFGPILVFSGATRLRTEVLPTTVFLELSVGNIESAAAVSLVMVVAALVVLVVARLFGLRGTGLI